MSNTQDNNRYQISTRSQHDIFKPNRKYALMTQFSNNNLPTSFTTTKNDKNWMHAMKIEYEAIIKNETWVLVPFRQNMNVIGAK